MKSDLAQLIDTYCQAWSEPDAQPTARPEGIDFVELSADGRIRRIIGFFGPLAAVGA